MTFTNETILNRIHNPASIDAASPDSWTLTKASTALADAAESLKSVAVDVGWTGLSAESSAEAFAAVGNFLLGHSDNVAKLQVVAVDAEQLVASGRSRAETVGALPVSSASPFTAFTAPPAVVESDPKSRPTTRR
ncbi:hypothetical protein [Sanguibacter sp. 25GB23B1]|uniref:hypothetical protein n=1 Tax=unclassified Sanguibacter TaxID=2645534 RepID=UPI0032AFD23D